MKYRIFLLLVLISCLVLGFQIIHSYYAPCKTKTPVQLPIVEKDTLQIAFIGDSWAFLHKPHDGEASVILSKMLQQPVRFRSFGICGFTSREICEQLYTNASLQRFLCEGCDYCVISAGINDTYKKMSSDYYAKSIEAIIQFFLFNRITPIIIEIPDYDIMKCYKQQTISRKVIRQLSMFITNTPIDCKHIFREALDCIIGDYKEKVDVLRYREWNGNYADDLRQLYLEDGLHLNASGYSVLDKHIGLHLLKFSHARPN